MVARNSAGTTDDGDGLAWSIQACRHKHARDVVEQYYAAFDGHTDGWQDLVTDDVVFDGPVQHARGKAEFVG